MDAGIVLIGAFILLCCSCSLVCLICTAKLLASNRVAADEERRAEEERLREQVEAQKKGVPACCLTKFPTMTAAEALINANPPASSGCNQAKAEERMGDVEETRGWNGGHEHKESLSECVVCLTEFMADEMVKKLPPCGHWFHLDCIDQWLTTKSTCPVCRLDMKTAMDVKNAAEGKKHETETASGVAGNGLLHRAAGAQPDHMCVLVDVVPGESKGPVTHAV